MAEADLAKSKVLLEYTIIHAPYTGVVTRRAFHPGDAGQLGAFIRGSGSGRHHSTPDGWSARMSCGLLCGVPDRDVPYLSTRAVAHIEIDALPTAHFETNGVPLRVSRWAKTEDPVTRTMRTEIDVQNPDGILESAMYGRVTLELNTGTPGALRVPSSAFVGQADGGRGSRRVFRGGKVHLVPVRYATDNGVEVEILSGLSASDEVIIRASGPVEEGTPVTVNSSH